MNSIIMTEYIFLATDLLFSVSKQRRYSYCCGPLGISINIAISLDLNAYRSKRTKLMKI